MLLSVGETFAGYRIVDVVGSGGMGEVYLAQHPRLPRRDALKILRTDTSADPDYRSRFEREADFASTLWHPNIVGLHDRGEADGHLWITMDFVDGLNASDLIAERYPSGLPAELVTKIAAAVASALDHAHKQGLLHRDVKPANIIVAQPDGDGDHRVLLADFGIARNIDDISGLTATNMTVGTVAYAAPEQLMGEDVDGRADQYALAATVYHLLTGSQLYPHSNPAVVISRHLNAPPPKLADVRKNLAVFDPALAVALSKDPNDRYVRCSDFARALSEQNTSTAGAASAAAPTQAAPVAPGAHTEASDPQSRAKAATALRRRPLLAAGAATLAVIGVVAVMVWQPWSRHAPSASPAATPNTAPAASSPLPLSAASIAPPTSPTSVPPGAGGIFPASEMDTVLLTPAEINTLIAGAGDPLLQMKESTYGMLNNAKLVDPPSCVGVIFTGDHAVFADTGLTSMHDEILESSSYSSTPGLTHVEQTVVVYPTPQQAQSILTSSQRQWKACAAGEVHLGTVGENGENGKTFDLGDVQLNKGVLSLPMVGNSQESGGGACQQVIAMRANVVVGVRSCRNPEPPPGQLDAPVSSVRNDAVSLANAMIDKITA
jgi:serine/threonine protein kinase